MAGKHNAYQTKFALAKIGQATTSLSYVFYLSYTDKMKMSAGLLLYRSGNQGLEVLLVHPSGNYNNKAPWSIPKGEPLSTESLEEAACRETFEETGVLVSGKLLPLGFADYTRSRKRVFCFAKEAPGDCQPYNASWEVDRAEFLLISDAKLLIHQDQRVFISKLESLMPKQR